MAKPEIIFLDIDGLLADFDAHIETHAKRLPNGKLNRDALDFEWWSTIPVYDGARKFYDQCKDITEVKFLTGPMVSVDCFQGKAHWIANTFLPDRGKWSLTDLIIMHSKKKQLLAAPNRVLIDDTLENVENWRNAGGFAIHHKGDFADTLQQLRDYIGISATPRAAKPPKLGK